MWAISLLTIMLVLPLLSAAPLDIAGDIKADNDGMHSHDENVTRGGKFFGHNQFDMGNINVSGSVSGDVASIGHQVKIDVYGHTDDHHHHEAGSVIECKEGLRRLFKTIDSNKDGLMDVKELLEVCHQNNIDITESLALRILTLPDKTVGFNMAKFCELLKDCPSTDSADSVYFLLQLFDKDLPSLPELPGFPSFPSLPSLRFGSLLGIQDQWVDKYKFARGVTDASIKKYEAAMEVTKEWYENYKLAMEIVNSTYSTVDWFVTYKDKQARLNFTLLDDNWLDTHKEGLALLQEGMPTMGVFDMYRKAVEFLNKAFGDECSNTTITCPNTEEKLEVEVCCSTLWLGVGAPIGLGTECWMDLDQLEDGCSMYSCYRNKEEGNVSNLWNTDGCSWVPDGLLNYESCVLHDLCYVTPNMTQSGCDLAQLDNINKIYCDNVNPLQQVFCQARAGLANAIISFTDKYFLDCAWEREACTRRGDGIQIEGMHHLETPVINLDADYWGKWGVIEKCAYPYFADKMELLIMQVRGRLNDDTALSGIRLTCSDGSTISSTIHHNRPGWLASWQGVKSCPVGRFIHGAQIRRESKGFFLNLADETGGNGVKFECTDGTKRNPGDGHWGDWSNWDYCEHGSAVYGIQTRVDSDDSSYGSDTGVNDVRFFCAKLR